eukprot:snap_masked-scaffold_54-processed-gene-0.19-mRNA-1 protein AED:1.00 eAED:1.00 QI:0/-1/0/0/-1/1/1/0/1160
MAMTEIQPSQPIANQLTNFLSLLNQDTNQALTWFNEFGNLEILGKRKLDNVDTGPEAFTDYYIQKSPHLIELFTLLDEAIQMKEIKRISDILFSFSHILENKSRSLDLPITNLSKRFGKITLLAFSRDTGSGLIISVFTLLCKIFEYSVSYVYFLRFIERKTFPYLSAKPLGLLSDCLVVLLKANKLPIRIIMKSPQHSILGLVLLNLSSLTNKKTIQLLYFLKKFISTISLETKQKHVASFFSFPKILEQLLNGLKSTNRNISKNSLAVIEEIVDSRGTDEILFKISKHISLESSGSLSLLKKICVISPICVSIWLGSQDFTVVNDDDLVEVLKFGLYIDTEKFKIINISLNNLREISKDLATKSSICDAFLEYRRKIGAVEKNFNKVLNEVLMDNFPPLDLISKREAKLKTEYLKRLSQLKQNIGCKNKDTLFFKKITRKVIPDVEVTIANNDYMQLAMYIELNEEPVGNIDYIGEPKLLHDYALYRLAELKLVEGCSILADALRTIVSNDEERKAFLSLFSWLKQKKFVFHKDGIITLLDYLSDNSRILSKESLVTWDKLCTKLSLFLAVNYTKFGMVQNGPPNFIWKHLNSRTEYFSCLIMPHYTNKTSGATLELQQNIDDLCSTLLEQYLEKNLDLVEGDIKQDMGNILFQLNPSKIVLFTSPVFEPVLTLAFKKNVSLRSKILDVTSAKIRSKLLNNILLDLGNNFISIDDLKPYFLDNEFALSKKTKRTYLEELSEKIFSTRRNFFLIQTFLKTKAKSMSGILKRLVPFVGSLSELLEDKDFLSSFYYLVRKLNAFNEKTKKKLSEFIALPEAKVQFARSCAIQTNSLFSNETKAFELWELISQFDSSFDVSKNLFGFEPKIRTLERPNDVIFFFIDLISKGFHGSDFSLLLAQSQFELDPALNKDFFLCFFTIAVQFVLTFLFRNDYYLKKDILGENVIKTFLTSCLRLNLVEISFRLLAKNEYSEKALQLLSLLTTLIESYTKAYFEQLEINRKVRFLEQKKRIAPTNELLSVLVCLQFFRLSCLKSRAETISHLHSEYFCHVFTQVKDPKKVLYRKVLSQLIKKRSCDLNKLPVFFSASSDLLKSREDFWKALEKELLDSTHLSEELLSHNKYYLLNLVRQSIHFSSGEFENTEFSSLNNIVKSLEAVET